MIKVLLLVSTLIVPTTGFASQLGCEQTVGISVSQMLHADETTDLVVRSVKKIGSAHGKRQVYRVIASSEGALPNSRSYLVVAIKGPQGTCEIESIDLEIDAQ